MNLQNRSRLSDGSPRCPRSGVWVRFPLHLRLCGRVDIPWRARHPHESGVQRNQVTHKRDMIYMIDNLQIGYIAHCPVIGLEVPYHGFLYDFVFII